MSASTSAFLSCSIYMAVGPMLILLNNRILHGGFPHPILLSAFGVLFSALHQQAGLHARVNLGPAAMLATMFLRGSAYSQCM